LPQDHNCATIYGTDKISDLPDDAPMIFVSHRKISMWATLMIILFSILIGAVVGILHEKVMGVLNDLYQVASLKAVLLGAFGGGIVGLIISLLLIRLRSTIENSNKSIHQKLEHTIGVVNFVVSVIIGTLGLCTGLYLAYLALPPKSIPTIDEIQILVDDEPVRTLPVGPRKNAIISPPIDITPNQTVTLELWAADTNEIPNLYLEGDGLQCTWTNVITNAHACKDVSYNLSGEKGHVTAVVEVTDETFNPVPLIIIPFKAKAPNK
jgi:hypothetical protein